MTFKKTETKAVVDPAKTEAMFKLFERARKKLIVSAPGLQECEILLRELLASGADIEGVNDDGVHPLGVAAECGWVGGVEALIEAGVDLESRNSGSSSVNSTALMLAGFKGECSCVEKLLLKGAKIASTDARGNTPLMFACRSGDAKCVDLMLAHGAKVSERNEAGSTALMHAVVSGSLECVKSLLAAGVDPWAVNNNGNTALDVGMRLRIPRVADMRELIAEHERGKIEEGLEAAAVTAAGRPRL